MSVFGLIDSANCLAEHLHEVLVLIIPCVEALSVQGTGPGAYASILPAVWSRMLVLRVRGLGSAWTTLHLPLRAGIGGAPGHTGSHHTNCFAAGGILHRRRF
jgi:hypothetical protein